MTTTGKCARILYAEDKVNMIRQNTMTMSTTEDVVTLDCKLSNVCTLLFPTLQPEGLYVT